LGASLAILLFARGSIATDMQGATVLVELFTSEGCSSCPPADALLERLDHAPVIVLSEHVDYWNQIGWKDPYSSHFYSTRQETYARKFRIEGPYTPQMVVDGTAEFVGNDQRAAGRSIQSALRQPKVAVRVSPSTDGATVSIETDPSPRKADLWLALALDSATSNVLAGENKNRRLHHVAVVKTLKAIGHVDPRTGFRSTVPREPGVRLVAFIQEPNQGAVLGAAMLPPKP
jgi:hypothetical protein